MYLIKWCDLWLAPFGFMNSDESRTHIKKSAAVFDNEQQAERRIKRVMDIRSCERNEFEILRIAI